MVDNTQQQPPATVPDETDEAKIWAEMEAAEKAKETPGEKPDVDAFAEKDESGTDTPADPAAAPAQAAADPQAEPDPWANAPPDLKAAHDAQVKALEGASTEHARRSIEGRIASYTRRLKERNEAALQRPAPAKSGDEAADPFAELAADYPEIAKPLEAKLAPITERLSRFDAIERSRQEAADVQMDAELKANEVMLEEKHPGWDEFLKKNGPAFGAWIVDQPLALRQAFITNQDAILDPFSAIETLDAFKDFVAAQQPPAGDTPPAGQPPPQAQPQRLNPRRSAQLAGSATPNGRGSRPVVSGIPEDGDPEAIWKAFAAIDPDEKKYRNA
jgi:hypothetical protein